MRPADGFLPVPGSVGARVLAHRGGATAPGDDWLAEEVAVALVFNGVSHAVLMATPLDLPDLALGFALTEGLVDSPREVYGIDVAPVADGLELRLEVSSRCFARLRAQRRSLAGRTGCGLCGAQSLAQVRQPLPAPPPAGTAVEAAAIARALRELRAAQVLQHTTGATHAAAWCSADGAPQWLREDVGRHNALDKVAGARAASRAGACATQAPCDGFLCVTSRASFEMVQKAALAGAAVLVAVSAPTALACRVAQEAGLALVGFARGEDLVVYTHSHRVRLPDAGPDTSLFPSWSA